MKSLINPCVTINRQFYKPGVPYVLRAISDDGAAGLPWDNAGGSEYIKQENSKD